MFTVTLLVEASDRRKEQCGQKSMRIWTPINWSPKREYSKRIRQVVGHNRLPWNDPETGDYNENSVDIAPEAP
jgi:hypothetical protein